MTQREEATHRAPSSGQTAAITESLRCFKNGLAGIVLQKQATLNISHVSRVFHISNGHDALESIQRLASNQDCFVAILEWHSIFQYFKFCNYLQDPQFLEKASVACSSNACCCLSCMLYAAADEQREGPLNSRDYSPCIACDCSISKEVSLKAQ